MRKSPGILAIACLPGMLTRAIVTREQKNECGGCLPEPTPSALSCLFCVFLSPARALQSPFPGTLLPESESIAPFPSNDASVSQMGGGHRVRVTTLTWFPLGVQDLEHQLHGCPRRK